MAVITVPVAGTELSVSGFGKPVADAINGTPWVTLTVDAGWTYPGAGTGRPPNRYRKRGDMVDLNVCGAGGTNGTSVVTLPVGFRPPYTMDFLGRDNAVWNIIGDGRVVWYGANNATAYLIVTFPTT